MNQVIPPPPPPLPSIRESATPLLSQAKRSKENGTFKAVKFVLFHDPFWNFESGFAVVVVVELVLLGEEGVLDWSGVDWIGRDCADGGSLLMLLFWSEEFWTPQTLR